MKYLIKTFILGLYSLTLTQLTALPVQSLSAPITNFLNI